SAATRRGPGGATAARLQVAEVDATLGQVVGREFERDTVTRQDADVVLLHLARRVGNQLVTADQRHAVARVGQHLVDDGRHVDEFFFGHGDTPSIPTYPARPRTRRQRRAPATPSPDREAAGVRNGVKKRRAQGLPTMGSGGFDSVGKEAAGPRPWPRDVLGARLSAFSDLFNIARWRCACPVSGLFLAAGLNRPAD